MKKNIDTKSLLNTIENNITEYDNLLNNVNLKVKIDNFKTKFTLCEVICKCILEFYYKVNEKVKAPNKILDMRSIPAAFKLYQFNVEISLLKRVFNSTNGLRKIRNQVTHSFNQTAMTDIVNNYETYMNEMDRFISYFRFDNSKEK